jgi:hypothetical protein
VECRPKEIDREKLMEMVLEASREEQKELDKYNREQAKLRKKEKDRENLKNCTGQEVSPESNQVYLEERFDPRVA